MAISLQSLRRSTALTPPRLLVHGVAGVGKSTFAAGSDKAVVVPTEDGLGVLQVPHFPLARSFEDVLQALASLHAEEHEFRTVVVDSVDWLEPLIWQHACQLNNWSSIEGERHERSTCSHLLRASRTRCGMKKSRMAMTASATRRTSGSEDSWRTASRIGAIRFRVSG